MSHGYVPGLSALAWRAAHGQTPRGVGSGIPRRTGEDIFEDGPYPRSLEHYIGQQKAKAQLIAAMTAARALHKPMDHVLLASGWPGIGKTALAKLIAYHLGVGMIELGGSVTDKDAAKAAKSLQEFDVLFLDEVHRLVNRGKARAEWLLTLLQDGKLVMPTGVITVPPITVVAATTDAQKLPETILDRFAIKPTLEPYTDVQAALIAQEHAERLGFGKDDRLPMPAQEDWLWSVALACDNNPRRMLQLLTSLRNVTLANGPDLTPEGYSLAVPMEWGGLSSDGLDTLCQHYLIGLLSVGGVAGESTMKALLNEEQVKHTEKTLIQKGFLVISGRGRMLTDMGEERANQLATEAAA